MEPIRISLGVAAFPEHGRNAEELIKAADWALYKAKQKGRDRVISALQWRLINLSVAIITQCRYNICHDESFFSSDCIIDCIGLGLAWLARRSLKREDIPAAAG